MSMLTLGCGPGVPPGGSRGGGTYSMQLVTFDGTNDYLTKSSGLTGASHSKQCTFVVWADIDNADFQQAFILGPIGGYAGLWFARNDTNKLHVRGLTSTGNDVVIALSTSDYLSTAGLKCFMVSIDAATSTLQVYDGDSAVDMGTPTWDLPDTALGFVAADTVPIGARNDGVSKFSGKLGDLQLIIGTALDLSIESNRRKFIDASGNPVNPADNGLTKTILLSGAFASWHTNDGSGGGFTVTGALADGGTYP